MQDQSSTVWLPSGWILEIKTHKSGAKAGTKYKVLWALHGGPHDLAFILSFCYFHENSWVNAFLATFSGCRCVNSITKPW